MSPRPPQRALSSRDGIALVIVLGFLALLVMLIVGFAVMMRTERLAARNYSDVVKAKHLIRVGLARAQSGLDLQLGGMPPKFIYPPWSVTNTAAGSVNVDAGYPTLISGDATNFVPVSLLPLALSASAAAKWDDIVIDDGTAQRLVGRYAFVGLNCSGLLDVNAIGGAPRISGIKPSEIACDNTVLPEFTVSARAGFPAARSNTYVRFESLPDFMVCGRVGGFLNMNPRDTFTYSRSSPMFLDGTTLRDPVDLAAPSLDAVRARAAFAAMGLPDVDLVMNNLTDYMDADYLPSCPTCVEPIPMINEIVISNRLEQAGTNYILKCRPSVEFSFPFAGITNTKGYSLTVAMRFTGANPATFLPRYPTAAGPGLYAVVGQAIAAPGPGWAQGAHVVVTLPEAEARSGSPPVNLDALEVEIVQMFLREGGTEVDRVPNGIKIPMSLATTPGSVNACGIAVDDPRLNSETAMWKPVGAADGTVGIATLASNNAPVTTFASAGADGTNLMYVRNGIISNTAELGYLIYDKTKAWRTLRILDGPSMPADRAHRVLDYFTVNTNKLLKGMLNPNTQNTNAMAAAILGASKNFDPVSSGNPVTLAEALSIATNIMRAARSGITNRSDLGKVTDYLGWPTTVPPAARESIIRNIADLMSTRQNVFTYIIAAQAINDSDGNRAVDEALEVTAEQRAVAVIWRDPIQDPANPGSHEQRVVFFKWLTE